MGEEAHKNQGPTHLQKDTKNGTTYNGSVSNAWLQEIFNWPWVWDNLD